jgi:hypothetical protein
MLTQAAQRSITYQRQLIEARSQSIDITNFETDLESFKHKFGEACRRAGTKFSEAIKAIDDSIAKLEATKQALLTTEKHLTAANNHAEGLTVVKLTKKNPTVRKLIEEARAQNEASYEVVG